MLVEDFLPPFVARSGDREVSVCIAFLLLMTLFRFDTLEIAFLFYEIMLVLKGELRFGLFAMAFFIFGFKPNVGAGAFFEVLEDAGLN